MFLIALVLWILCVNIFHPTLHNIQAFTTYRYSYNSRSITSTNTFLTKHSIKSNNYNTRCQNNTRFPRLLCLSSDTTTTNDNDSERDLMADRIESLKYGGTSLVSGIIASLPITIAHGYDLQFSASWEFHEDIFSLMLFLFGLVYRYASRGSSNPHLKLGVVTAFVLTRTLSLIQVPSTCSSIPLNCGPPLHYIDISMVTQGLWYGIESLAAYFVASFIIDTLVDKKWLSAKVVG